MRIRVLSRMECVHVLTASRLGHLACTSGSQPYVVPIYFAYGDNHLYAFSMPGKKIEWMRANPHVSIAVEERGQDRTWKSVVVDGRYEELPDRIGHKVQRDHAWSLLSRHTDWWEPGALQLVTPGLAGHSEHVFFRVLVDDVSGREATAQDQSP